MKKIVLIDSNALVHRAFHALPPSLNTATGIPTNAIFGFMSVMVKMIKDLKPDYVVATFDLAGPTFRHEEFAEYKSHRVKAPDELYLQIPYIKEILTKFGIPIFEKEGFEADDLIGALAEQAKTIKDLQVIIMTGDLDTLQLVEDDKVVVFTLRKGVTDTFTYNQKEVVARYGLQPSQVIDFKGLKGDQSDNIPGVPGIGEKTASLLIQEFGSIEKLYEFIENNDKYPKLLSPKLVERLVANKDQAFFSKRLATIIRDVDISFDLDKADWRKHTDKAGLEKMLKDLGLYSIVKRLQEMDSVEAPKPATLFDSPKASGASISDGSLIILAEDVNKALDGLNGKDLIIIDIQNGVLMLSDNNKSTFGFSETLLKDKQIKSKLKDLLEDSKIGKVGHDVKKLSRWALERGIMPVGFAFDTRLAGYILNSEVKDYLLERLFFVEFQKDVDPESLNRLEAISQLRERYEPKLKEFGLSNVMDNIEVPLSPILARMEKAGIKVKVDVLEKLEKTVTKELTTLEKKISEMAGGEFNINSPKQLSIVLFEKLGLKGKVRKTGKGALSTAVSELEKLAEEHPIIELIIKYRELQKLKTTYIEPFPSLIDSTGRIHTTYDQTGAATGRLSSLDPNLQNIPVKTELGREFRKAFVAGKDKVLLSCDYSQLELRIAAHLSSDKAMTDAFKRGEDIHTRTAAQVFGVETKDVTKNMRNQAKTLNFGVLYGMGVLGFQRASGTNRDEARQFLDSYKKEFYGLAVYMEGLKEQGHRDGYVSTLFGRRRLLPDINSTMPMLRAGAERIAINMPIQGTAADLIKIAMINVQKLIDEKYSDSAQMLLQVHDELLFEVKSDIVEKISKEIKHLMESAHAFDIPIIVDTKFGNNWWEMDEIK
ncbi:MAG: DNA polymerase I [Patescibacteria group bacterium]